MSTRTDTLGRKLQVDEVTEPQVVSFDIVALHPPRLKKAVIAAIERTNLSNIQGAERSCVAINRILRTEKPLKGQACSYRGTKN
jgi:hypothetical protein